MDTNVKVSEEEVLEEQRSRIRDVSSSYRIYLMSRRDFLIGVSIGITGSIASGYIIQLDRILFLENPNTLNIGFRILIILFLLFYLSYRYRKRTKNLEEVLQRMNKRISEINELLKKE
jgi:hypothetical protein